jgi:hypothetical protein
MEACSFRAGRHRISAHDGDRFLGCDSQPPDHHAHRRWFMLVVIVFALAIAVALICGTLKGLADMALAFPDLSSVAEGAAWDKFFAGFGRVAVLVLAAAVVVTFLRRRRRKKIPPQK